MKLSKEHRDRMWNILIVENRHIAKTWKGKRPAPSYWEAGDDSYMIGAVLTIVETLQGETK